MVCASRVRAAAGNTLQTECAAASHAQNASNGGKLTERSSASKIVGSVYTLSIYAHLLIFLIMQAFNTVQFIEHHHVLPESWASYLMNGDVTSFDNFQERDKELDIIDQYIEDLGLGDPVYCTDEPVFMKYHDAQNYGILASQCIWYTFLEQVDDLSPDPSLSAADRNPSMLR